MPLWLRLILRFDGGIRTHAIGSLLEAGFVDVFRRLHPAAPGFTMPAIEPGVRLDYVIASRASSRASWGAARSLRSRAIHPPRITCHS